MAEVRELPADIILVTCKTAEEIQPMVDSINEQTYLETGYRLIPTCCPASASVNRNFGLDLATASIVVMLDDDIIGFHPGWLSALVEPLDYYDDVCLVSARLLDADGTIANMMGGTVPQQGIVDIRRSSYRNYFRVTTAAIAFPNTALRFDENFVGSGYEDTDFMNRFNEIWPDKRMVINNDCKLIHLNEEKNQGGPFWNRNRDYYMSLYPDDETVKNQQDWTKPDHRHQATQEWLKATHWHSHKQ